MRVAPLVHPTLKLMFGLKNNQAVQLVAAASATVGLVWCMKTLHELLREREEARLDGIAKSKAVAELHKVTQSPQHALTCVASVDSLPTARHVTRSRLTRRTLAGRNGRRLSS